MSQVGTYTDGRALNYDESGRTFTIGDAPVTPQQVIGYDRAGQLTWASDELRNWAHQLVANAGAGSGPPQKKRIPKALIVVGVIVGVLMLCTLISVVVAGTSGTDTQGGTATEQPAAEPAEQPAAEPAEQPAADQTTKMGQPLKVGDLVFTVNAATATTQLKSVLGNKSGNWILVTATVKNESKEAVTIDSSFFKLLGSDGAAYETDSDGLMYLDSGQNFFLEKINPNLSKKGQVLFAVPAGSKPQDFKLQVQTGFWGTETGEIALEK